MEKSEQKLYALEQAAGSSDNEIYAAVLTLLKNMGLIKDGLDFLDIGCGKGSFLNLLAKSNEKLNLTGADLFDYSTSLPTGSKWLKQDLNQGPDSQFGSYDLVTAIEVIEHLENPRAFIRNFSKLVRPGGIFIITTPNLDSITSILSFILRGYHSAFGPRNYPAHISPVGARDLSLMVSELEDLNLKSTEFIPNGRIPGMSIKWRSLFPFLNGKRFADNYISIIQKGNL